MAPVPVCPSLSKAIGREKLLKHFLPESGFLRSKGDQNDYAFKKAIPTGTFFAYFRFLVNETQESYIHSNLVILMELPYEPYGRLQNEAKIGDQKW